jgi:hypothetical protein
MLTNVSATSREPKVSFDFLLGAAESHTFTEFERAIPDGLSFDEVVNNKALPVRILPQL